MIFSKISELIKFKPKQKMKAENLETELQKKCINYISGKSTDQDFNERVEELSKHLKMSKYEVIEYILDCQERLQE